jgi:hypothetical protein
VANDAARRIELKERFTSTIRERLMETTMGAELPRRLPERR